MRELNRGGLDRGEREVDKVGGEYQRGQRDNTNTISKSNRRRSVRGR